jgi:hypothetical protein
MARHRLVSCHVGHFFFSVGRCGADSIDDALGLAGVVEVHQRHLHRLAIGAERAVQPAPVGSGFRQAQAAFPPQYASQFLDQMLLGRSLRFMLGRERRDEGAVFVGILPGQHGVAR